MSAYDKGFETLLSTDAKHWFYQGHLWVQQLLTQQLELLHTSYKFHVNFVILINLGIEYRRTSQLPPHPSTYLFTLHPNYNRWYDPDTCLISSSQGRKSGTWATKVKCPEVDMLMVFRDTSGQKSSKVEGIHNFSVALWRWKGRYVTWFSLTVWHTQCLQKWDLSFLVNTLWLKNH